MMEEFVVLLIFHLLATTSAQISVTILSHETNATVCQGDRIILQCRVTSDSTPVPGSWSIVGTGPIGNSTPSDHFISFSSGITDLIITSVTLEENNTEYLCSSGGVSDNIVLQVEGIPTVANLMATDNCDNVTTSWDAVPGVCRNSVQYNITLLTSSGDTIESAVTNDTSYTFNDDDEHMLKGLTSEVTVSIFAFNGNFMGGTSPIAANLAESNAPDIDITMVDRCVSSLNITWNDATQCVPVDYTVILTNTSSGELQNNIINGNSFSFPRLTSNTSFTITVSGTNRFGQNASMMLTSTLKSNVSGEVVGLTRKFIDKGDINITWNAPTIDNDCYTSVASIYEVMINYTIDTTVESVCNNTTDTSILLSNFDGHPLDTAIYDYATVTAINDGGRSNDSDSISLLRDDPPPPKECFDKTWCIIVVVLCCILGGSCIISCTSSSFIFICLRREEDSTITINIFMVTIGILSFGTAIPVWYIYDNCIRNKEDKDSSKDKRCFNILSVGSCGFVYVLNLLFDRPSKIKDRDAPDSQNMPLQDKDTNKPVRSAAEEQALYSYARTGPINVVMEGGSSTRPGDKPRQT